MLQALKDDSRVVGLVFRRAGADELPALGEAAEAPLDRCEAVCRAAVAAGGLLLLVNGPWLSWALLARLPALGLEPLPLAFGRRRYRTGLVARRSAEDLTPVRMFEDIVRTVTLEGAR